MVRLQGLLVDAAPGISPAVMFKQSADILRRNGVVVLKGYYPAERVAPLRDLCLSLMDEVEPWRYRNPKKFRDGRVVLRNGHRRSKGRGYRQLVADQHPTINIRRGWDDGLVDVFRPECLWPEHQELIADVVRKELVAALLKAAFGRSMAPLVRNVYVHDSRAKPRGYHVDGYGFKAKSFVYLTNVETPADGPYCYATRTHSAPGRAFINRIGNKMLRRRKDEYWLTVNTDTVAVLGSPGDVIVSIQCGAHRGLPLAVGRRRAVLVEAFEDQGRAPRIP